MAAEDGTQLEVSVSEFVELFNQTVEYAYPSVIIVGELSNFRVSRNRWVYFDLKDEFAVVKFFGTVYQLPGPLEEGMLLRVRGQPRLHPLYGFSVTIQIIQPSGEGSIKRASEILASKLAAEGLFSEDRKRLLPYPPAKVGLITAKHSAAYADFIKILNERWRGVEVELIDVQVQGEIAPLQIQQAIEHFNEQAGPPDILVIIRGGGSVEDLAAFNTEQVTRAVAGSRVPTLVAIGHEIDFSLAELAADRRASTPSNAAEMLSPDRNAILSRLNEIEEHFNRTCSAVLRNSQSQLRADKELLMQSIRNQLINTKNILKQNEDMLALLNPEAILRRGYAVVRTEKRQAVHSASELHNNAIVNIQFYDGTLSAVITKGQPKKE